MIEVIPAIDIIDGKCVRLTKGDYARKTIYGEHPADIACRYEQLGFRRLHVVDLDGAKSKHIVNIQVLNEITRRTNLIVDFGGGIKTDDDIRKAFDNGAAMVTAGSIAVTEAERFMSWLHLYGADKIILGADVRGGMVSINGWKEDSSMALLPFLTRYINKGVHHVLCTDISKDGTLSGPAVELYKEIMATFPDINLIASGGMSSEEDIEMLNQEGIPAVVLGKAIYEGRIDLEAIAKKYVIPVR